MYNISKTFKRWGAVTDKVASVCRMFGLTVERLYRQRFTYECRLEIDAGDIVYITGPSGAGKSVLLSELERDVPANDRINLADIVLPDDRALIDCIQADLAESLRFLSLAGLNRLLLHSQSAYQSQRGPAVSLPAGYGSGDGKEVYLC
jgi:ABC-type ATPase with predicted acetyltransferase domain